MSTTFESMKYPNFRLWFFTNLSSSTAVWMQRVCQIWVVLTVLTDNSAIAVGFLTALQFLPQLFLGPIGGVLADSVDRRRFIQLTQSIVAVLGLVLGVLLITDVAQLWHVYLIAFATGTSDALTSAVRNTFVTQLVPKESLPNAISLNSTSFNIARLFGPALAGLLIDLFGPGWVFVMNFGIFLIPILLLQLMKSELFFERDPAKRHKGMLREGFAYTKTRSDIIGILIIIAVVSGLGLNMQMTQALMATEVYGLGAGEYGLLGTMLAVGSLSGALLSARRKSPRFSQVLMLAAAFGLFEALSAIAPSYWTFALMMVPTGFAMLWFLITCNTLIQISVPAHLRGRVLSIYFAINLGSTPIGAPFIGWVGETFGPRWTLGVGGLASIVIALIVFAWLKPRWDVEVHGSKHFPFVDIDGPRERAQRELQREEERRLSEEREDEINEQRARRDDHRASES